MSKDGGADTKLTTVYGVEWQQPAIVAMGLAQGAVHNDPGLGKFLLAAEERAKSTAAPTPMPSILSLLDAVRNDEALPKAARSTDANKIRDGVLKRALEPAIAVAARMRVTAADADQLAERTAEMYHAAVLEAAAAALCRLDKEPKWDFFLM